MFGGIFSTEIYFTCLLSSSKLHSRNAHKTTGLVSKRVFYCQNIFLHKCYRPMSDVKTRTASIRRCSCGQKVPGETDSEIASFLVNAFSLLFCPWFSFEPFTSNFPCRLIHPSTNLLHSNSIQFKLKLSKRENKINVHTDTIVKACHLLCTYFLHHKGQKDISVI